MKDGWTSAELELRCSVLGLSPEATTQIIECWKQKAPRMASSLLSRTLKANQLIDLDWNFGVTAASDDCDQVSYFQIQRRNIYPFITQHFNSLAGWEDIPSIKIYN